MRRAVLFAAALFFVTAVTGGSSLSAPQGDAPGWQIVKTSLVVIGHRKPDGSFTDYGTGFSQASNSGRTLFLTDDHVVFPGDHGEPAPPPDATLVVMSPKTGAYAIATVRRRDPKTDLAIVSAPLEVPPLKLSRSMPAEAAGAIAVGGFPFNIDGWLIGADRIPGQEARLSSSVLLGHVTSITGSNTIIFYSVEGGIVDQGTSGGPVFDPQSGDVYGMVWGLNNHPIDIYTGSASTTEVAAINVARSREAVAAFIANEPIPGMPAATVGATTGATLKSSDDPNAELRASAAEGNADAQNTLGLYYLDGTNGVPQDYAQAMRYFQLAAAQGNANAISNLGWMYDNGQGMPRRNPAIAVSYYQKAAAKGNATAQNNLATLYYTGRGVPHDPERAFTYYRAAADQNDSTAEYNLGSMYLFDRTHKNLKLAYDYLKRASDRGDADADVNLGVMYDTGMFVHANATEAAHYYKLAAVQGNARGQADLGAYYVSVKKYQDAMKYFRLSSAQHDPLGNLYLGDLHAKGYGVPKDQTAANVYYARAVVDYGKTLQDDPYNASSYRSRGRAYLALGESKKAVADFSKAVKLDPTAPSYRSLGFYQFYAGDFSDSARNLRTAAQLDNSYPYVVLWMHLADARNGVDDTREFTKKIASLGPKKWPGPAVQLFLGKSTVAHMVAAATNSDERCEATFYNAEYDLLQYDKRGARPLFARALATCPGTFIEYFAARGELSRL